jgi:2-keto-4-pentenoate hydratase/2-oxohepta-3-ene-1,7-dioic acid hydratase in catechol pathway
MRLAAFTLNGAERVGLVKDDGLVDLAERLHIRGMRDLLARGLIDAARSFANERADQELSAITFLPPVRDPTHIFCIGINYRDHLEEVQQAGFARAFPNQPSVFIRFADTLVGHGAPLLLPRVSESLDYEAELAIIVGKGGRHIDEADALDHIAGYACFNDASVRDWQFHTTQVTPGKNFLETGGFGPWMVTADEVSSPDNLDVKLILNDRTLQHGNTRDLIFSIPKVIAYLSTFLPLRSGDVIATGTPAGVGFSRKPPIFLRPGDVCEVHIDKVGVLRNTVAREQAAS